MSSSVARYQLNPLNTDTVGFYDYCVPLPADGLHPVHDSLTQYYFSGYYDFVTPVPPRQALRETVSIFSGQQLRPASHGPVALVKQPADWILMMLLFCLAILAWARVNYPKRLTQVFSAMAQPHHINQMEREGNLFGERITVGLVVLYFITMSLFIMFLAQQYLPLAAEMKNYRLMLFVLAGVVVFQALKAGMVYALGVLFDSGPAARFHQLNILIFNIITGIWLIPVCFTAAYRNSVEILVVGGVSICLIMIYRLVRTAMIGISNKNYNLFYLILYLCTLEILPIVLLLRVAFSN